MRGVVSEGRGGESMGQGAVEGERRGGMVEWGDGLSRVDQRWKLRGLCGWTMGSLVLAGWEALWFGVGSTNGEGGITFGEASQESGV